MDLEGQHGGGIAIADLDVALVASDETPSPLVNFTLTSTITNSGPYSAQSVTGTLPIPTGYTYVSDSASAGSYNSSTGAWTGIGTITSGNNVTLAVTLKQNADVVAGTTADATATAASTTTDPDSADLTDTVTLTAEAVVPNAIAEYRFLATGQQPPDYSGNGYTAQLGATTGADADDPTWNAGGWFDFDSGDVIRTPAALATAVGTGSRTWIAIFKRNDTVNYTVPVNQVTGAVGLALSGLNNTHEMRVIARGSSTITGTSASATPHSTWGFVAGIFEASTRVTGWETAPLGALTRFANETASIPATLNAVTYAILGNSEAQTQGEMSLAFVAQVASALSDATIQGTTYGRVKAFIEAAKPTISGLPSPP